MSNTITIELCAEDRARIDRLTAAMERRACDKCVATAIEAMNANHAVNTETKAEPDPVQAALAETLSKVSDPVEPTKNTTEAIETPTQATAPQEEEKPTEEEPAQAEPTRTVTHAELKAKVIQLCAKSQAVKEQTRDIVRTYAQTVTEVPEDKVTECYEKLEALEG